MGHPVVNEYSEIVPSHFYFPNTLFDDRSLDMSGCILPRTGVSGWNSFWFGSSEFDKTGRFSSFQAQVGLFLLKMPKLKEFLKNFQVKNTQFDRIWDLNSILLEYICLADVWTWFKFNDTVQMSEHPSLKFWILEALVEVETGSSLKFTQILKLIYYSFWIRDYES